MAKRSRTKRADNPAEPTTSVIQTLLLRVAIIIAAGIWVYAPALHGDWLWDDDLYIFHNPLVRSSTGLWDFWFHPARWVEYYPIEQTFLWIEWRLFGMDTLGYHLVTLAFHLTNALLVWRLLDRLGLPKAWLGGLLFVLHPVNVESVAWPVELKNTLSLTPLLLAMLAYLKYDEGRQARHYACSLGLFLVAMLCKASVLMFPALILLYAWWKHGRLTISDWKRSALFFLISCLLGLLGASLQHATSPDPVVHADWTERLAAAGAMIPFCFSKCVLPIGLLPIYPSLLIASPSVFEFLPWLFLAAVLAILWVWRATWSRPALLGFGFFLLNLVPVFLFVLANASTMVWSVDHLLYLPLIGVIGLVVAVIGFFETLVPVRARIAVTASVTILAALLAFEARGYAVAFTNEATLWGYTVEHSPRDWQAQDNLAKALLAGNEPLDAIPHFEAALALHPGRSGTLLNLGRAYVQLNRIPEGIALYDQALALKPDDPEIYNQKGVALLQAGRIPEALEQFQSALRLRPAYPIALDNEGSALAQSGRLPEAIAAFTAALRLEPGSVSTLDNLGSALTQAGRGAEATAVLRQALQLDPTDPKALQAVGPGR